MDDPLFGTRHVQCLMVFLAISALYSLRINLSVAIVPMTQLSHSLGTDSPVLSWDEQTKGTIMSSFFWGYLLFQIPAGQLAERYGPKFFLATALFISGVLTLLTPAAAIYGGFYWMVGMRVLQGAVQGFLFPSVNYFLSKWAPTPERGRLFTWVFNGTAFGTVVTMAVAGLLADCWGWPSVFYVSGGASILWSAVYCYIGANSPQEHPTITDSERKYIMNSLPSNPSSEKKVMETPWKAICTSGPLWGLLLSNLCQNWGSSTLLTQIPSYMTAVFKLNITESGLLSALPFASCFMTGFVFAAIGDWMLNKRIVSKTASKKIWNSIAMWGGSATLCIVAFSGVNQNLAISMLILGMSLSSGISLGYLSNHLDLSPNFSGTLMGITNGLSNLSALAGPLFVGYIVTDPRSHSQWQVVFLTSAASFFIGNLIFLVFGKAEVQPWNFPPEELTQKATSSVELSSH